jgi:hypothetical protein
MTIRKFKDLKRNKMAVIHYCIAFLNLSLLPRKSVFAKVVETRLIYSGTRFFHVYYSTPFFHA